MSQKPTITLYQNKDKDLDIKYKDIFIHYLPNLLDFAYEYNMSEEIKDWFNHLDYFDFHYRRYLSGYPKTMHRVFYEIRRMKEVKLFEIKWIHAIFRNIEQSIINNELYEVMPIHLKAKCKVLEYFFNMNK